MYRIVIADDEKMIREGITKLIDWGKMNCQIVCTCENGKQVLQYISENEADIIVCDIKMPGMDGITLLHELQEYPDIMSVILTAYSDFDFARKAIRYGACDYIIKNDFLTELPKTILNMIGQLELKKETKERREHDDKKMKLYYLEALLLSKALPIENGLALYELNQKIFCVSRCEITYEEEYDQYQDIVHNMENFFNIAVKEYEHYLLESSRENITILFCADAKAAFTVKDISIVLNEIMSIVEDFMRITIKFGVSEICAATDLPIAYRQATEALFHISESGNEILIYAKEFSENNASVTRTQYGNKIAELLLSKQYAEAETLLEDMKQNIAASHLILLEVQISITNMCSMIFRKIEERYIWEDARKTEIDIYNKISSSTTLYTLFSICNEVFVKAREVLEEDKLDKHYLITAIERYIQKNYDKNFTLQDISEEIHISSSYISRLYKKKRGVTLTSAINLYRIDQSKELLRNTSYKIYEVAQKVGIEDAGYFTALFIKYVGCNPSEYRGNLA